MRRKHKAHIETSRAKYDRRIRNAQARGSWLVNRAELACLIRGHSWMESAVEFLETKVRYIDTCRHCGRTRIELVTER